MQVVEDDDIDAAVELPLVGAHVGFDRRFGEQRPLQALDRQVDEREGADGLTLPVLEHLEVVLRQVADEPALCVGDERVDLDVLDLGLEGGGLERGRRLLLADSGSRCERHERGCEANSSNHGTDPGAGTPIKADYSGYTEKLGE